MHFKLIKPFWLFPSIQRVGELWPPVTCPVELIEKCVYFRNVPYGLRVQISGNFAPGYPELFFERVPGTRIFVMFAKITLKERVGTQEAAHVDIPVWTHWIYYAARLNSAELISENHKLTAQISEILPFMKSNVYFALSNSIRILICVDYTIFVDGEINKILLHAKIFRKRSLFSKGKSRDDRLMWRGFERAKATTKHMR